MKKSPNAFMMFVKEHANMIKEQMSQNKENCDFGNVNKELVKRWKKSHLSLRKITRRKEKNFTTVS